MNYPEHEHDYEYVKVIKEEPIGVGGFLVKYTELYRCKICKHEITVTTVHAPTE